MPSHHSAGPSLTSTARPEAGPSAFLRVAGRLLAFAQLVPIGGGLGVYLETPPGGPDWKMRFQATILLPRRR